MWSEFISNELKSVYNPFHVVLRVTPSLLVSACYVWNCFRACTVASDDLSIKFTIVTGHSLAPPLTHAVIYVVMT